MCAESSGVGCELRVQLCVCFQCTSSLLCGACQRQAGEAVHPVAVAPVRGQNLLVTVRTKKVRVADSQRSSSS